MLSNTEITEIEYIFILIDHGVIPYRVTLLYLEWLKYKNVERFALLNWMLKRWVFFRKNKFHLPKRILGLNNLI